MSFRPGLWGRPVQSSCNSSCRACQTQAVYDRQRYPGLFDRDYVALIVHDEFFGPQQFVSYRVDDPYEFNDVDELSWSRSVRRLDAFHDKFRAFEANLEAQAAAHQAALALVRSRYRDDLALVDHSTVDGPAPLMNQLLALMAVGDLSPPCAAIPPRLLLEAAGKGRAA